MSNLASLRCILPELVLAGTAVVLFILAAVFHKPKPSAKILFPTLSFLGLLTAFAILAASILFRVMPAAFSPSLQTWLSTRLPICRESLFFGLLATDSLATIFRALVVLATALGVFLSLGSPSVPRERRNEYYGLLMVLTLGMCLLASANHLLMIYVAIETVSLVSYVLAGFDDRTNRSSEAGLKYVLFGGVASGIMLFGMSLIYGLFGTLTLPDLYLLLSRIGSLQPIEQWVALIGFVFILVGFGFKIAAVPFHMWCPDVYEGAPTPFTALLSVGPKAAGFAVLLRFSSLFWQTDTSAGTTLGSAVPWVVIVAIVSAATMTLGNFAAIHQNNLKRLLAYSSIAHAGYILMGVAVGKSDGTTAAVLYLLVYLLMNVGAFAVVSAVDRAAGSEDIKVYYGLGRKAPILALVMAVFLFSLTGLPPTAGFIGKLYLFAALIKNGGFWFIMLALVGILNSVVSLYFYARVLRAMYFEKPGDSPTEHAQRNPAAVLAVVLAVPVLILGIFWQPLATLASWSAGAFLP